MSNHPLHLPLFFQYSWQPVPLIEQEQAELISRYETGKPNFGFENIHEIPADGPRLELKAQTLEEAEGEAARHWRKRTGLGTSDRNPAMPCSTSMAGAGSLAGFLMMERRSANVRTLRHDDAGSSILIG